MHSIKVTYDGEIRRFSLEKNSFAELKQTVARAFSIQAEFSVKYKDDDGDWISLDSDIELSNALKIAKKALYLSVSTVVAPITPVLSQSAPVEPSPVVSAQLPATLNPNSEQKENSDPNNNMPPKSVERRAKRNEKKERNTKKEHPRPKREDKPPKPKLVSVEDISIPLNTQMKPSMEFVKTWKVKNESGFIWAEGCQLALTKGDISSSPTSVALPGPIAVNQEFTISISMKAPEEEGKYKSFWRLKLPNGKFVGPPLRVRIAVKKEPETPLPLEQLQNKLETMGFLNSALNKRLLTRFSGDMDKVVAILSKKQRKSSI